MNPRLLQVLAIVVLAACCRLALADPLDAPGRVGRVSLVQGQVSISGDVGGAQDAALLNWPVTSHHQLTTARDARAEFRVGSTAVRLDGDSALDIVELDDDTMQLRLHYGSVSIRVRNPDLLRGFELSTPQGRIRLQDVGTIRVDADRTPDTTLVSVFDGSALVDSGGASLTVRAGRRAELRDDDVHTGLAARDGFDDWNAQRDVRDDRVTSVRYVSQETTGYEELDQYGSWRDSSDYGALWVPRSVAVDWAPYRDGRWAWVAPWGWTWIDNAPWGYAPFHYGRWVMVGQRWCWAPGRHTARPVWSPALVGWVGGSNWQLSFSSGAGHRNAPALGWYPLAPREVYRPNYQVRPEHVRVINAYAEPGHDAWRGRTRPGVTVIPHSQFDGHGTVLVRSAPRAVVPSSGWHSAPSAAPPVLQGLPRTAPARFERGPDSRRERGEMAPPERSNPKQRSMQEAVAPAAVAPLPHLQREVRPVAPVPSQVLAPAAVVPAQPVVRPPEAPRREPEHRPAPVAVEAPKPHRIEQQPDRQEKPEKAEKPGKPDKQDRQDKQDRPEKAERGERGEQRTERR
jgi:hypothetical protein